MTESEVKTTNIKESNNTKNLEIRIEILNTYTVVLCSRSFGNTVYGQHFDRKTAYKRSKHFVRRSRKFIDTELGGVYFASNTT